MKRINMVMTYSRSEKNFNPLITTFKYLSLIECPTYIRTMEAYDKDRRKLPPHILKDGVKWLILPSKTVMQVLSIWPDTQNKVTFFLNMLVVISYTGWITTQTAFVLDKDTDLAKAADATAGIIAAAETIGRRIFIMILAKRISKILNTVYFEFWPSDIAGKEVHSALHRDSWIMLVLCAIYISVGTLWGLQGLVQPLANHLLPLMSKFPFDPMQSPYYEMIYIWQGILCVELPLQICGDDLFFISVIWNCVAQFRLLKGFLLQNFEKTLKRSEVDLSEKRRTEAMQLILVCYRRHINLIRICKEIEHMLTIFVLMLYLCNIGTLCLSGFLVTVVRKEIGRPLAYFWGHMSQIFIYCFVGNHIITESTAVGDALYQCGWHLGSYDREVQKSLVLMILRAQRPVTITLAGFGVLSLASYMKLLQFCFSVYTLLSKMMRKQQL